MGPAIPLILLPGLHGTSDLLVPLIDLLSRHRPVAAVDYPSRRHLSFDELVDYVLARAPSGPFAVLGESFSGPIAIEIAAREARVTGLILAATFARYPLPRSLAPAAAWLAGLPAPPRKAARLLAGRSALPRLVDDLASLIEALPRPLIRHRVREALRIDQRVRLAATTCPLLCLAGRRDHLAGRRAFRSITDARPDGAILRFDAGHMLLETHAEEAAEAIEAFLGAAPPQTGLS